MLDRTISPEVFDFKALNLPDITSKTLKNGIKLNIINHGDEDVCKIVLVWNGGKFDVENATAPEIMTKMFFSGTEKLSADEITETFDFYGSRINVSCDAHFTTMSITALNRTLPEILPVMTQILNCSTFPENEFENQLKKYVANKSIEAQTVQYQSKKLCKKLLFGENHPAFKSIQNIDEIKELKREEVVQCYNSIILKTKPEIFIAGKITEEVLSYITDTFSNYVFSDNPIKQTLIPVPYNTGAKTDCISLPEQVQSSMDILIPTIDAHNPDYISLKIAIIALGGYFGSRLNKVIREEKGLTYGIHSHIYSSLEGCAISINSQFDGKTADEVTAETISQIRIMKDEPISQEEIASVRKFYMSILANTSENLFATLDYYISCYKNSLPNSFFSTTIDVLENITPAEIRQMAEKYFDLSNIKIAIAGNV